MELPSGHKVALIFLDTEGMEKLWLITGKIFSLCREISSGKLLEYDKVDVFSWKVAFPYMQYRL